MPNSWKLLLAALVPFEKVPICELAFCRSFDIDLRSFANVLNAVNCPELANCFIASFKDNPEEMINKIKEYTGVDLYGAIQKRGEE